MYFLIRRIKSRGLDINNPEIRRKFGVISGAVGILLNIVLFTGKLIMALVSGSVAIMADAFNNLSDAGSSVVTIVGFKLSGKKPDSQHPFGHGRFEYISGFIVSVVIILVGFELALSSIKSIKSTEEVAFDTITVAILIASISVKLYMALYNFKLSAVFKSAALKATAKDSLNDVFATSAVLLSLIISHFTTLQLDSYMGLLVSLFILYSGVVSARDTLQPLLGASPSNELVTNIEKIVMAHQQISGMHDLIVHDYGPGRFMITLHAEVSSSIDVFESHSIIDDVENELEEKLGCEAVIHFDPIDTNDDRLTRLRSIVVGIVESLDERLTIHDFRYVPGNTHTNLIFDVVVPYDIKNSNDIIVRQISDEVAEQLPNHVCVIKCDKAFV